jgi:hypothetical protein
MKLGSRGVPMRRVLAIAALGVTGFCGVAACATAGQASSQPRPLSAATDSTSVAQDIARIATGNGGLGALDNGDGQATLAYCDPSTVSNRIGTGIPVSASCGINYSDGSVWRQTVTVTFDSHGSPVTDWASLGTELLLPAGG